MGTAQGNIVQMMQQVHDRDISMYDPSFLRKTIEQRLVVTGTPNDEAYFDCLAASGTEAAGFYESLRISYSEFFRNPLTFAILEQSILPLLADRQEQAGPKEIRIWSAGCASGQEAYSIAMLLEELSVQRSDRLAYRIFATDRSEEELTKARIGLFDAAALRNVPLRHVETCFSKQGDGYAVVPRLKEKIDFSLYDLLDERAICPPASIYGDFDIVFCSNLLFYYTAEKRRMILDRLNQCLASGGTLVTGEAERSAVEATGTFQRVVPLVPVLKKSYEKGDL